MGKGEALLDNIGPNRLDEALKHATGHGASLSIIAPYFTIFAYGQMCDGWSTRTSSASFPVSRHLLMCMADTKGTKYQMRQGNGILDLSSRCTYDSRRSSMNTGSR